MLLVAPLRYDILKQFDNSRAKDSWIADVRHAFYTEALEESKKAAAAADPTLTSGTATSTSVEDDGMSSLSLGCFELVLG